MQNFDKSNGKKDVICEKIFSGEVDGLPDEIMQILVESAADSNKNFYIEEGKSLMEQDITEECKDLIALIDYLYVLSNEEKEIAIKLTTHPIGTLRNELSKRKHHPELARRGWAKYCHTKTIEYTIKHYDVLRNVLFEDYMNMSPWYKRWDEILAKLPAEDISYLPNSPEDDCESKY